MNKLNFYLLERLYYSFKEKGIDTIYLIVTSSINGNMVVNIPSDIYIFSNKLLATKNLFTETRFEELREYLFYLIKFISNNRNDIIQIENIYFADNNGKNMTLHMKCKFLLSNKYDLIKFVIDKNLNFTIEIIN